MTLDTRGAARWILDAEKLTVLVGPGPATSAGLDMGLSRLTVVDIGRDPVKTRTSMNEAHKALTRLSSPPASIVAAAQLIDAHPDWAGVALSSDALLARSGAHPVVELCGRVDRARCASCDYGPLDVAEAVCPACGGPLRPDVVLADEVVEPRRRLEAEYVIGRAERLLLLGVDPSHALTQKLLRNAIASGTPTLSFEQITAVPKPASFNSLLQADARLDAAVTAWRCLERERGCE